MNAASKLIAYALMAACIASCVAKTADESSSLESGSTKACERLTPCDSDVTGDWRVDHICFFVQPIGTNFFDECPAGKVELIVDSAGGAFSFDKKGSYTESLEYAGRSVLSLPRSCLAPGKKCADLEDDVTTCEVTSADVCKCTTPVETDSAGPASKGTYHRSGTTLDLVGDTVVNYCAKGDTMKLETRVKMPEMGDKVTSDMQIVLKRR